MIWVLGFNNKDQLKERSIINYAERFHSPILLIHGSDDSRASIEIANKFNKKIFQLENKVELVTLSSEHFIPMDKIKPYMETLLNNLK